MPHRPVTRRGKLQWPAVGTVLLLERKDPVTFAALEKAFGRRMAAQILLPLALGKVKA